jgi:hypothetical protein
VTGGINVAVVLAVQGGGFGCRSREEYDAAPVNRPEKLRFDDPFAVRRAVRRARSVYLIPI